MIYFSYNDYSDCKENGKIEEIRKLEENTANYILEKGIIYDATEAKNIAKILKEKNELKEFYSTFLGIKDKEDLENIMYCKSKKLLNNKKNNNIIISKIRNKEIFVIIKVIENIDNNIPYKMFEYSYNLIQNWYSKEKIVNKRYPIVIPVVIYIGKVDWKNLKKETNGKLNYTTFEKNKIIFSYNIIDIKNLEKPELENNKTKLAEELIKMKNKYLQVNQ